MKKYLLSSISACCGALGLFSFNNSRLFVVSYYWFYVMNPVSTSVIHPTFAQISGDYLGYSTFSFINNAPDCIGSDALCLVGYTVNSISGFTSGGTPTGLKTFGGFSGVPKPYATKGSTTQDF